MSVKTHGFFYGLDSMEVRKLVQVQPQVIHDERSATEYGRQSEEGKGAT
jgi:hypothetical protein